ncbi:MAG: hypothetical protein ACOZIN_21870 [Myxococcota bacterium]
MRRLTFPSCLLILAACGYGTSPSRVLSASQALTGTAELLELESGATRQELFRDIARASEMEAGRPATGPVFFPVVFGGELVAAPGFDPRADLLQAPDAGEPLQLSFDGRERWAEDRRESLQGLSEREAVELIARSLLAHWGIRPQGVVSVDRATGAPYAAAYVDGTLRVNPAFVYLAAASVSPSAGPSLQ